MEEGIKARTRGPFGGAHIDIRVDRDINDSSASPSVEVFRINAEECISMSLDVWTETDDLDVALKRLVGYDTNDLEIWQIETAEATITAAVDPAAVNAATEVINLISGNIRSGVYAVFAKRTLDPNDGTLHVFGHAKG